MSSQKLTGRILFGINNIFTVDSDNKLYECRIKGKVFRQSEGLYNPLAAGDIVDFERDSHSDFHGVITSVHERKNAFTRWNRKRMAVQLIASNIDILFCMASPDDPPFRPRFLDRLMLTEEKSYQTVVLLNKTDLEISSQTRERLEDYERIGIRVLKCSAKTHEGIDQLKELIDGRQCAFAGHSGVGKSSVINILTGSETQKTSEISYKYNRGKHTTNYSILIPLGTGSIIDTPGIRDIFIKKVEPVKLSRMFIDFVPYIHKCGFSGCSHIAETDCAVKKAVETGKIHYDRYETYLKLYSEMTEISEEIYGPAYS
ncbi:MAG: ribosome small subunit-dependent GTPase A [Spirochaetia bacterium]|jgi:ribosome biogenesis GTPase|nr:ribosome small subunit-dependent GTPase A [Spirochaetia bacterium]